MQKLVIMLNTSEYESAFEEGWPAFLAVAERLPGLRRETSSHIESVLVGVLPYNMIHELYFDSMDSMKQALASPEGRAAGTSLQEITRGQALLFYADHTEDSAENLVRLRSEDERDLTDI